MFPRRIEHERIVRKSGFISTCKLAQYEYWHCHQIQAQKDKSNGDSDADNEYPLEQLACDNACPLNQVNHISAYSDSK